MNITDHRSSEHRPGDQRAPPRTLCSESVAGAVSRSFFTDLRTASVRLADLVGSIDKSKWATTDPDPVEMLLSTTLKLAPPEFWPFLAKTDIKPLVARVRNWLLAMIRAKRKDHTGSGLRFLMQLDIHPDTLAQIKLQPVLKVLRKSLVGQDAVALAEKHNLDLDAEPVQKENAGSKRDSADLGTSPPQTKLRSELAIPKRQARSQTSKFSSLLLLNKRGREEPSENTEAAAAEQEQSAAASNKKHRSSRKKVQWRDDNELLRVKYFRSENSPMTLSSEFVEAHGTFGFRSQSQYDATSYIPQDFESPTPTALASQIGPKRGGTKIASGPPSELGMPMVLGMSPREPDELLPTPTVAPTTIPKFEPALPSAHDLQTFLNSQTR